MEDTLESFLTPLDPLPSNLPYVISYVGTPVQIIPLNSPSFKMANISRTSTNIDSTGVQTPSSIVSGGTFSFLTASTSTPTTVDARFNHTPGPSGGIQSYASFNGSFSFGMPFVGIPRIILSSIIPFIVPC